MKKINALVILIAAIGMISLTGFASTGFEPMPAFYPYYGTGFGGFGGMPPVSFASLDYGAFNRFNAFGGFGGMTFGMGFGPGMGFGGYMDAFEGFGGMEHGHRHVTASTGHRIVPIPADDTLTASAVTFDEAGEIRVRPFDDEDLFVED